MSLVSLGSPNNYQDIMSLHERLYAARDSLSPRFRMADLKASITVAPYILVRRYTLELLFPKTLCILHRYHMAKSVQEQSFQPSRQACVGAAMAILRHKADLAKETQPGGLLYGKGWITSSIEQSDFLLASVILCLELSFRAQDSGEDSVTSDYSHSDLLGALQTSYAHLEAAKGDSADCQQAFATLSFMLLKSTERCDSSTVMHGLENAPMSRDDGGQPTGVGGGKQFAAIRIRTMFTY